MTTHTHTITSARFVENVFCVGYCAFVHYSASRLRQAVLEGGRMVLRHTARALTLSLCAYGLLVLVAVCTCGGELGHGWSRGRGAGLYTLELTLTSRMYMYTMCIGCYIPLPASLSPSLPPSLPPLPLSLPPCPSLHYRRGW